MFRDIKGYEGLYQIDEKSNIISLGNKTHKGIHEKKSIIRKGYYAIQLWKNGIGKIYPIHRIKAIVFIQNPLNLPCINHIDGNKLNNDLDNLEWCTVKENSSHASKLGLYKKQYGIDHPDSKKIVQYSIKGEFIREWNATMDVERELGIRHSGISRCCLGKLRTSGGFIWKHL